MRRAALFDLDGTLVDSWHLYIQAFRRTLEAELGRPVTEGEVIALQPSAERRLLQTVVSQAGSDGFDACFARFLSHYRSLHRSLFEGPYPGVLPMLTGLREEGWLLGVVTGKSRAAWEITAEAAGLPPFDVVVTDDDVQAPKPAAEGIERALARLDVAAERAWYLGDSLLDCRAACAAGVVFGAALWGKGPDERAGFAAAARRAGGREQFERPLDVLTRLRQLHPVRSQVPR